MIEKPTIYFVDDMEDFREFGYHVLQKEFEVQLIDSGKLLFKLLKLVENNPERKYPDIITLDLVMPKMDGFEVLEKLQEHKIWKKVPVVILSGADKSIEKKCFQLGATEVLFKPIPSRLLLKMLKLHIEVVNLRKQINESALKLNGAD